MSKVIPNQYGKIFIPNVLNNIEIPIGTKEVEENGQTNTEIVYRDTQILKNDNDNKILWNKDNINSYYLPLIISPIYNYAIGYILPRQASDKDKKLYIGKGIYSSRLEYPSNFNGNTIYQYFEDNQSWFPFFRKNTFSKQEFKTHLNNFINEYKNLINIENIYITVQELTYEEYKNFMVDDFYPNHSIKNLPNYGKTILKIKFPSLNSIYYNKFSNGATTSFSWTNPNYPKSTELSSDNILSNYLFTYIPINKNNYYIFNQLYKEPNSGKEYYFNPNASLHQVSESSIYTRNKSEYDLGLGVKHKGIIGKDPIVTTDLWGPYQSQNKRILTIFSYHDDENNESRTNAVFPEDIFKNNKITSEYLKITNDGKEIEITYPESYAFDTLSYDNKTSYDSSKYPFYLVWNCQPLTDFCRFVYGGLTDTNINHIGKIGDYKNPYLIYDETDETNIPRIYQYETALLNCMKGVSNNDNV